MNILIAVDLSPSSEKVIAQGQSLAQAYLAKIWLLHVAPSDPDFVGYDVGPQTVRDAVAKKFHVEHTQIQAFSARLRDAGLDATALLVQGATSDTILKEAEQLQAEVIVLGSHGRGMAKQLLLGSTSSSVIKHSKVPVLVVPTHERT
ncbi:MAG: universal stress protein [Pseudomonadales bacterium]